MNTENAGIIKENIEKIKLRVERAARKSGRDLKDIKIVAVTKTVDVARIMEAIDAGVTDIGENRVQELCKKYDIIGERCNWHLIGTLQTNKVRHVIDKVTLIHSLDRIELAEEIQKRAERIKRVVDVLVQVNVAKEETKSGIYVEQAYDFVKEVAKYGNIRIRGLMTIAPFAENPEEVRFVFRELHKLYIDISKENTDNINMDYLSMGMSNDFEVAIEEGSNMVRIGTAIFGKRY